MRRLQKKLAGLHRRSKRINKAYLLSGIVAVILIMATAIFLGIKELTNEQNTDTNIAVPPDNCAISGNLTFGCYKDLLTKTVNDKNPQSAIALLKQQYPKIDYVRSQCHQLVHVIGQEAYAKYGNLTETFKNGEPFCWSGYYHGVMEQLSNEKGEEAVSNANAVCRELRHKQPSSFSHYNCVHGLGHGFMFILNQDLFRALGACDALTDSYESSSCYGGVFMQNIMNDQSPDQESGYSSAYLKNDDPLYPCTAVEDRYKQQCYAMQTSHALQVVGYDYKKVFELCHGTPQTYRSTCYQSLGRDASGQSISNVQQTKEKCLLGGDFEAQSNCIIGAAKDFVSYFHSDQQAQQLCSSLADLLSTVCSNTVKSYYAAF